MRKIQTELAENLVLVQMDFIKVKMPKWLLQRYHQADFKRENYGQGPDPNPFQPAKFDQNQITTVQIISVTDNNMMNPKKTC